MKDLSPRQWAFLIVFTAMLLTSVDRLHAAELDIIFGTILVLSKAKSKKEA